MPLRTEHYFLEAFLDGDAYLAIADKRRFNTIDAQMNRVAEIVGNGRINGWEISEAVFPKVTLSAGSGLIDKFYVNTFNDQELELSANGVFYIYTQRRVGTIGTNGPKSNVASITYTDDGAPAAVVSFSTTSPDPFTTISTWTANTEVDLDHYDIFRSDDGAAFLLVGQPSSGAISFEDETEEDTSYTYRIFAVDQSGNLSASSDDTITTGLSTIPPPNPVSVLTPFSEAGINVLWKRPPNIVFSKIKHWELSIVRLNVDDTEITSTRQVRVISRDLYHDRIDNLDVGQKYKITLQTIDTKDRQSSGISRNVIPQPTPAPRDPQGIAFSMSDAPNGVEVTLSWTSGDNEYDPAISFRYKIYVTIDGRPESVGIDVPIGFTEEQISLFTFNLLEYFPIPENALVTFRITALDESGFESFGNYVRFVTFLFTPPLRIRNLQADFDSENGLINVSWDNQPDTVDINLQILKDDLEDAYEFPLEIFEDRLGKVERYVLVPVDLDNRYTFLVTPFNIDDVPGPVSTVAELTFIATGLPLPAPPSEVDVKTNDRQITLTWDKSTTPYASGYNLYRKVGAVTLTSSDWTLFDSMPVDLLRFPDFGLDNGTTYSYYITATDVYGRESLHLPDNAINLNFVEAEPQEEGALTEPENVVLTLIGTNQVFVAWDSLLEEFDSFSIFRSINNRHSWIEIASVNRDTFSYLDIQLPLIDGTIFYYTIDKAINDADVLVQTSNVGPVNSLLLAKVTTGDTSVTEIDVTDRRDIADMIDPLAEYTDQFLLPHRHLEVGPFDPDRIDLNPELIVTDWTTVDGRIFTTTEEDIIGTSYIVKVDGRFPSVFFSVDPAFRRIIFSEPIADLDPETQLITGDIPEISLRVLGVEEVQGILEAFRFDDIHARQIQFGVLNKEQLPGLNHEGRIREDLLPKRYLLERFSNHTFIVPQGNTDEAKAFGDGTTFYTVIESDGQIQQLFDFDLQEDGVLVGFNKPSHSTTTVLNLKQNMLFDLAEVNSDPGGFQSNKSYNLQFEFEDDDSTRWVRITTENTLIKPNPVIDLEKRLRFRVLLQQGSIYLTLGIREITSATAAVGEDGGTTGPIEWVGATELIEDVNGNVAPRGILIQSNENWQEIDIDLKNSTVNSFENGNGNLPGGFGVLEHLAFTINPDDDDPSQPINIYLDEFQQVSDLLVAGTSQGIQLSRDFGVTWEVARLTDTPVHKFYRSSVNGFLWAITADQVLLATDPVFWFVTQGTTGVQYIRDIVDDSNGNMFISTDKGVYWLEISLIRTVARFKQTQPINAFTTDVYALFHNPVSSGIDEIWASTEVGIYKTVNFGRTWEDTGMSTAGLVAFQMEDISTSGSSNIIGITRKHVLRKLSNALDFEIIADFEDQHSIFDLWKFSILDGRMYISTGSGVFMNTLGELFTPGINQVPFDKVLDGLDVNSFTGIAFGLDVIDLNNLGVAGQTMFVGMENRLMTVSTDNTVRLRKEFRNREIPSFFVDNQQVDIGYIYNSFNNVVAFREPQAVTKIVSAANLPRRIWIAVNGGWAQTNPDAEIFVYRNGFPKWLDWGLDNTHILGEVQDVEDQLRALVSLTTFNSLYPKSQELKDAVLQDVATIREGGEEGASLINDTTIVQFLDDYTRFLSLITEGLTIDNGLSVPEIRSSGITIEQRPVTSRAALLEQKEEFEANSTVGITINITTGAIDFLTAFANATDPADRAEFTFQKFDRMQITVFNANVTNTGDLTHTEIEDGMENLNSGLSSNLARAAHANLIKSGIFMESQHNFLFDRYNVSNVQSKFYAAFTNDWYDILNSTVDYVTILQVPNIPASRFANVTALFTEDPYFSNKIWVGTDNNIIQYDIDSGGNITLEDVICPSGNTDTCFIWDLFVRDNGDIYAVVENSSTLKAQLFKTSTFGVLWEEVDTVNLPDRIFAIKIINGNLVVGTEDGTFYSDNDFGAWFQSDVVPSDNLGATSVSLSAFRESTFNYELDNFITTERDRWFFTSGQGIEFFAVGRLVNNNATVVNKIFRFKNLTFVGTDRGIYNDGNSMLSDNVQFGIETTLESTTTESAALEINDIVAGVNALYCSSSNGKVYRFFTDDEEVGNEWRSYQVPDFGPVHKMLLYEMDDDSHFLYVFSYDQIKVLNVTRTTGVFG